jgi:hypothetical protein
MQSLTGIHRSIPHAAMQSKSWSLIGSFEKTIRKEHYVFNVFVLMSACDPKDITSDMMICAYSDHSYSGRVDILCISEIFMHEYKVELKKIIDREIERVYT